MRTRSHTTLLTLAGLTLTLTLTLALVLTEASSLGGRDYSHLATGGVSAYAGETTSPFDAMVVGDIGGDGLLEVVYSSDWGDRVDMRTINADGSLGPEVAVAPVNNARVDPTSPDRDPDSVRTIKMMLTDLTGDNHPDLLYASSSFNSATDLLVRRNNGAGGWISVGPSFLMDVVEPNAFDLGPMLLPLAVLDVDADTHNDILFAKGSTGVLTLLRNAVTSPGTTLAFDPPTPINVDASPLSGVLAIALLSPSPPSPPSPPSQNDIIVAVSSQTILHLSPSPSPSPPSFTTLSSLTVDTNDPIQDLYIADWDADSIPDLIFSTAGPATFRVGWASSSSSSSPTYTQQSDIGRLQRPSGIACPGQTPSTFPGRIPGEARITNVLDVSRNGRVDVVVSSYSHGSVLWTNEGVRGIPPHTGTFGDKSRDPDELSLAGQYFPSIVSDASGTTQMAVALVVQDVTGDGFVDVLMMTRPLSWVCPISGAALTLSPGMLTLTPGSAGFGASDTPTTLDASPLVTDLVTGDVNNDGNIDLVYLVSSFSRTRGVYIRLGSGSGQFDPFTTTVFENSVTAVVERDGPNRAPRPASVLLADMTNNGVLDIVLNYQEVAVDEGGTRQLAGLYIQVFSLIPGTRDQFEPLAPASGIAPNTFCPSTVGYKSQSSPLPPGVMVIHDVNADSYLDVLVFGDPSACFYNNPAIFVFVSNAGDGSFSYSSVPVAGFPSDIGDFPTTLAAATLPAGSLTAVACTTKQCWEYQGLPLTLGREMPLPGSFPDIVQVLLAPVDGDDVPDLVLANTNNVMYVTGNGDGTYTGTSLSIVGSSGSNPSSLRLVDLDNNGALDVLVTSTAAPAPPLCVLLSGFDIPGPDPFVRSPLVSDTAYGARIATIFDANSDGVLDTVLADDSPLGIGIALATSNPLSLVPGLEAGIARVDLLPGCPPLGQNSSATCLRQRFAWSHSATSRGTRLELTGTRLESVTTTLLSLETGRSVALLPADGNADFEIDCTGTTSSACILVASNSILDLVRIRIVGGAPGISVSDSGTQLFLTSSNVTGCSTSGVGGGVAADQGAIISMVDVVLENNVASLGGGSLRVGDNVVVSMEDVVVADSHSTSLFSDGGGIRVDGSNSQLVGTRVSFERCSVSAAAGGALALLPTALHAQVLLSNVTFSSCSAYAGGAFSVTYDPASPASAPLLVLDNAVKAEGCYARFGGAFAVAEKDAMATPLISGDLYALPGSTTPVSTAPLVLNVSSASLVMTGMDADQGILGYHCNGKVAFPESGVTGTPPGASSLNSWGFACLDALASSSNNPAPPPPLAWTGFPPTEMRTVPASVSVATPVALPSVSGTPLPGGAIRYVDAYGAAVVDIGYPLLLDVLPSSSYSVSDIQVTGVGAGLLSFTPEVDLSGVSIAVDVDVLLNAPPEGLVVALTARAGGVDDASFSALPYAAYMTTQIEATITLCPSGWGRVSGGAGPLVCALCPENTESPGLNADPCLPSAQCAEFSERSLTIVANCSQSPVEENDCVCFPGYFTQEGVVNTPCLACPPGAECCGSTALPVALPGFFEADQGKFIQCVRPSACVGGSRGSNLCKEGYSGYLCNDCAPGWYTDEQLECVKCPPSSIARLLSIVVVLVLAAVGIVIAVAMSYARALNEPNSGKIQDGEDGEDGEEDLGNGRAESAANRMDAFRKVSVPASVGMGVVALQIVGILARSRFEWSESSQNALGLASVFTFDSGVVAAECTLPSFHARYAITLLLFASFFVVALVSLGLAKGLAAAGVGFLAPVRSVSIIRAMQSVVAFAAPLLYIPMAKATLVLFDCSRLPNGNYVLDADPSVKCFDGAWFGLLPLALVALGAYVVGLPLWIFVTLYRKRRDLIEPQVMVSVGQLYRPWRLAYWWMGVADLGKRLAIVVVTTFASRAQLVQIGLLALLLLSLLVFVTRHAPYYVPLHNAVDAQLNLCLVAILLLGGASLGRGSGGAGESLFLDVGVIVALVALVLVIIVSVFREVRLIFRLKDSPDGIRNTRFTDLVSAMEVEALDLGRGVEVAVSAFQRQAGPVVPSVPMTSLGDDEVHPWGGGEDSDGGFV